MTSHTPGPWKVSRRFDIYEDTQRPGIGGSFIATTKGNNPLPESINRKCEADARLIAAAPEMLQLLREFIDGCDTTDKGVYQSLVDDGRELIARIEGV